MELFSKKLWLWGHDVGSHDNCGIPRPGKMTPAEGALYLGIPNVCRVVYGGKPKPPFEEHARELDGFDKVVWSVIGDSSSMRNNSGDDSREVGIIAKNHPNIIGGILDDFLNPKRCEIFPPKTLGTFKKNMSEAAEREMQLWTVIYTHELAEWATPYLAECDAASLWTWNPKDLVNLDENFKKLRGQFGDKPILGGCYLWNYSAKSEMPPKPLKDTLDLYYRWLISGRIDGVIFCSNNVVDVGLESVEIVKSWIEEHKDEVIK